MTKENKSQKINLYLHSVFWCRGPIDQKPPEKNMVRVVEKDPPLGAIPGSVSYVTLQLWFSSLKIFDICLFTHLLSCGFAAAFQLG